MQLNLVFCLHIHLLTLEVCKQLPSRVLYEANRIVVVTFPEDLSSILANINFIIILPSSDRHCLPKATSIAQYKTLHSFTGFIFTDRRATLHISLH